MHSQDLQSSYNADRKFIATDQLKDNPEFYKQSPKSHPLSKNGSRWKSTNKVDDLRIEELLYEDDEVFR